MSATRMPSLVKSRASAALKPLPAPTMSAFSGTSGPRGSRSVPAIGQQGFGGVARCGALQRFALELDHHRLLLACPHQPRIDRRRRPGGQQPEGQQLLRLGRPAELGLDFLALEEAGDVAALEQGRLEREVAADALESQRAAPALWVEPADDAARRAVALRRLERRDL